MPVKMQAQVTVYELNGSGPAALDTPPLIVESARRSGLVVLTLFGQSVMVSARDLAVAANKCEG